MFTGIIEEVGIVKNITASGKSGKIRICANKVLEDVHLGDSIAVNGVCLTVCEVFQNEFVADVMMETVRATNLSTLTRNSKVNLERAMSLSSRFGGHIVTGHVDTTGTIVDFKKEENAVWISIKADEDFLDYVVYRGSITIDGVSLTVAYVDKKILKVSIIPHTKESTTLLGKKVGDLVNLESDIIGKYVKRFTSLSNEDDKNKNKSKIDLDFLMKNGF